MPPAPTGGSPRIVAIDLARFVALAGMFAAHTWNRNEDGSETLVGEIVAGRAAALFAVLAGIGVVFVTRGALARGDGSAAVRMLLGRGAVILAIGLLLGLIPTNVYIVIAYYGLLFCVMAPLVLLRSRWLAVIAIALALAGPAINVVIRESVGVEFELGTPSVLDLVDPLTLARTLLLTGIYPVLTWLVYGLVGVIVGRALLGDTGAAALRRSGVRLASLGVGSAALGALTTWIVLDVARGRAALADRWASGDDEIVALFLGGSGEGAPVQGDPLWLAAATPHTGTTPDLLLTIGIALALIGALLAALPRPTPRLVRALLPAWGAGGAPLTVYSIHVILTAAIPEAALLFLGPTAPFAYESGPGLWLFHLAVALIVGAALGVLAVRGPLETVVTAAGRRAAGRAARPARDR